MGSFKNFDFSSSVRTKNNFDVLIDEKYNVNYIDIKDIRLRENQVFELQSEDYINSLAEDIKINGLDNPLIVRMLEDESYDLICGRHRFLALQKNGEEKIPCIIQKLTDDEAEIKLINSNLNQRHSYKQSELAKAYLVKKKILQKNYALDKLSNGEKFNVYEELAKDTQYSSKTIERIVKINFLIDEFKNLVDLKKLNQTKYIALTKLSELEQNHLYNFFLFNQLSFTKLTAEKIIFLKNEGLSDENLEKTFFKTEKEKPLDNLSNEIKVEELYTEVGLEKEKWLEIIDILRNKEIIK